MPETVASGDKVTLAGLQNAAHLNGRGGVVLSRVASTGRCQVQLEGEHSTSAVKHVNLQIAPDTLGPCREHPTRDEEEKVWSLSQLEEGRKFLKQALDYAHTGEIRIPKRMLGRISTEASGLQVWLA